MDGKERRKEGPEGGWEKRRGREGRGACNLGVYLYKAQKETDSTLDNFKVPSKNNYLFKILYNICLASIYVGNSRRG